MAAKLTPAQREEALIKVWQMSMRGATTTKIAAELGISAKGVGRLLKTARERAQKQNEAAMDGYLAEFVGEQRAVIETAWERLGKVRDNSLNVGSIQSNIIAASKNIATARGVFVERTDITSKGAAIAWTELVRQIEAEEKQTRTPANEAQMPDLQDPAGHG
jgi:DNA-binding CsgD family transcriptional regulator